MDGGVSVILSSSVEAGPASTSMISGGSEGRGSLDLPVISCLS